MMCFVDRATAQQYRVVLVGIERESGFRSEFFGRFGTSVHLTFRGLGGS
jgi:hypothetical protein